MKRLLRGLTARLRGMLRRDRTDREMDEELAFHLDMETEKLVREGVDPAGARRRALVAFGGVERTREKLREGRRVPMLESLWSDLRFAARSLRRSPTLSLVAALTIALGIGATTTVFSTTNGILLRTLPIPDLDRVRVVDESRSGAISNGVEGMHVQYPRYETYREATTDVFESLAAHRLDEFAVRLDEVTLALDGALTSGNYFETLGIEPALGRAYTSDDALEIVISHDLWLARFGGDPGVVGRSVRVDGRPVSVVGVGPRGFHGATIWPHALWVPVGVRNLEATNWGLRMTPFGRLRDGVEPEVAEARVDAVGTSVPAEEVTTVRSVRLREMTYVPAMGRGMVGGFLGLLLGMALLVLLIAGANIAGVMLARSFARRREVAVRLAMGAGRGRLIRHLLTESLLLFAIGGVVGVGIAFLGTSWLARMPLPPQVPIRLDLAPDGTVLAFAVLLTGVTGLAFGLVPALGASRPDLVPALKAGGHGASGAGGRLRTTFVGGQVAFAVLLLLTATLFGRSLQAGLRADLGFEPEGLVVSTIDLGAPHEYDAIERERFFADLIERVRGISGVERVSQGARILLSGSRGGSDVRLPGRPDGPRPNAGFNMVDPEYAATMGLELVAGRWIAESDRAEAPRVAVVNEWLAEALFQGESAIGRRIEAGISGEFEIVGVVRNGRYVFVTEAPTPFVFLPIAQEPRAARALHVRAPGAESAAMRGILEAVRALDPDVAPRETGPLPELIGFSLFPHRFAAQLVGAFGVVGLVLAAMGIYGVLAFQVARRAREFGVRRALGATGSDIVRRVVGRGGLVAVVGALVGVGAGAVLATAVRAFLFGIEPLDPPTFIGVPAALLAVALVASLVPAVRATRIEAVEALREE